MTYSNHMTSVWWQLYWRCNRWVPQRGVQESGRKGNYIWRHEIPLSFPTATSHV